ncbi:hypothetical protein F5H01DRAFT_370309 [Linnemannia elongata]|nr:hypothetical protein F5H01DRAFT_370309 [Linnemannia elongata]
MTSSKPRRWNIKKTVKRTVSNVVKKVLRRIASPRTSDESSNSENDTNNATAPQENHSVTSPATALVAPRLPQVYESFVSTMVDDRDPWSGQDLVGEVLAVTLSELSPLDLTNIHFQDDLFTVDKTEIADAHEEDATITDSTEEQFLGTESDIMDAESENIDTKYTAAGTDDIEEDLPPSKRHKKDFRHHEIPSPAPRGLKRNRPSTAFPSDQPDICPAREISFCPFNHTFSLRVIRPARKKMIAIPTRAQRDNRPRSPRDDATLPASASPTRTPSRFILARELDDSDGDISMCKSDSRPHPFFATEMAARNSMTVCDRYLTQDNATLPSAGSSSLSSSSVIQNIQYQGSHDSSTCSLQGNTTGVSQSDGPPLCRPITLLSDLVKVNETLDNLRLETERHTRNIDVLTALLNIHSWIMEVSQQLSKLGLDASLPILPFPSDLKAPSTKEITTETTPPPLTGRNRPPLTLADLELPEVQHTQDQHQQESKFYDMWTQHVGFPPFGAQDSPSESLTHQDQDQPHRDRQSCMQQALDRINMVGNTQVLSPEQLRPRWNHLQSFHQRDLNARHERVLFNNQGTPLQILHLTNQNSRPQYCWNQDAPKHNSTIQMQHCYHHALRTQARFQSNLNLPNLYNANSNIQEHEFGNHTVQLDYGVQGGVQARLQGDDDCAEFFLPSEFDLWA